MKINGYEQGREREREMEEYSEVTAAEWGQKAGYNMKNPIQSMISRWEEAQVKEEVKNQGNTLLTKAIQENWYEKLIALIASTFPSQNSSHSHSAAERMGFQSVQINQPKNSIWTKSNFGRNNERRKSQINRMWFPGKKSTEWILCVLSRRASISCNSPH